MKNKIILIVLTGVFFIITLISGIKVLNETNDKIYYEGYHDGVGDALDTISFILDNQINNEDTLTLIVVPDSLDIDTNIYYLYPQNFK